MRGRLSSPSSSWKDEAIKRILKVAKLSEVCVKYVDMEKDALANQIFKALVRTSSKASSPVKLSDVAEALYGNSEKSKQDIIRLTIEKTLLKCGIVEKFYFSERDVRYFPAAYRFQQVRRIEDGAGRKTEQLIGDVIEIPQKDWPISREYFDLEISRAAYENTLSKLESDFQQKAIDPQTYSTAKEKLQNGLNEVLKALRAYQGIAELMF